MAQTQPGIHAAGGKASRRLPLALLAALGLTLLAPATALAKPEAAQVVERPKIQARMLVDVTHAVPGETLRVGVAFKLDPGWHIYWRYPGVGLPTKLTFEAPDGWHFGAIQWPVPQRYENKAGSVSYGYADEVVLFSEVRVPASAKEGTRVELRTKASWLVCKENCIPGSADLAMSLPVATGTEQPPASEAAALFERFASQVPAASAPEGVTVAHTLRPAEGVRPGDSFVITVTVDDRSGLPLSGAESSAVETFLPAPRKGLEVTDVRVASATSGKLELEIEGRASKSPKQRGDAIEGVVQLRRDGKPLAFETALSVARLSPDPGAAVLAADPAEGRPQLASAEVAGDDPCAVDLGAGGDEGKLSSFWLALLLAFVGGLILNAMPCVLPVLSLKVMSLVQQSGDDRKTIWRHGLFYTVGVMLSFLVFALIIVALKASGETASWSFQFQDPVFVGVFAAIIFAFALSLFGVFEIALPGSSKLDKKVAGSHGYASSFNYGVFAVLLGTPCTAPFMGPAMAYAFTQPAPELTAILLMLGLGLAFPFLLLARFPRWTGLLPKPGPWLLTFKKLMAFLLVGTAVWMVTILSAQLSRDALNGYLIFLAILALALFVYGNWTSPVRGRRSRLAGAAVALGLIVGGAMTFVSTEPPAPTPGVKVVAGMEWHDFDAIDVEKEAADGRTVFIDFTAVWCATCDVNEEFAIYTPKVRQVVEHLDVLTVIADYSLKSPKISEWLKRFDHPSVPMYLVLPAGKPDEAIVLPSFPLSTDDVVRGLCKAGPSARTTASLQ